MPNLPILAGPREGRHPDDSSRPSLRTLLAVLLTLAAPPVLADGSVQGDLARLEGLIESLRSDYERRIGDLERRLAAAESRAERAERAAADARETAEEVAYAPQPTAPATASTFNPAIGAVLIGTWADTGLGEDDIAIPGFQLAGEPGPGDGLSLGETEINFNASIDDKFFGNLTFALADEEGELAVELEEAYVQTTALPVQLTAGRFFSGIGYLNGFHLHADDFIDRPLPYQAFLAGQYLDDGLQARWVAPTDRYLEFGAEVLRGASFPAGGETDGEDAFSVFVKTGGDFAPGHSWKAGLSYLDANARGRSGGHHHGGDADGEDDGEAPEGLFGDSTLYGLEAVYKWAPGGNAGVRNLVLQGEYFRRDEDGVFDGLDYRGEQDGWYLQGVYQFRPQWRIGYRHDRLDADNEGVAGTELDDLGFDPRRDSLLLEWFNSEFSRVRLQYIRDRSNLDDDDRLLLQYVMSIGAHRAHQF